MFLATHAAHCAHLLAEFRKVFLTVLAKVQRGLGKLPGFFNRVGAASELSFLRGTVGKGVNFIAHFPSSSNPPR
jgi:hypothetical protein